MITDLSKAHQAVLNCCYQDRHYLKKRLNEIERQQDKASVDDLWQRFNEQLAKAEQRLVDRKAMPFSLQYDTALPVVQEKAAIAEAINNHSVVIIAGETGSGKTTQIGKICLELGLGRLGQIAHTQPRRVAATSVAKRIADELQCQLGETVGYQIRFANKSQPQTLLKLMTDGVLLTEIAKDPWLSRYDTLILDEAHERSLNIDFLLGYCKKLLQKRPELKLIITSATIDVERFSRYFNQAPVIVVEGRSYPVSIEYRPPFEDQLDLDDAIVSVLNEIQVMEKTATHRARDVLVFLPGESDIRMVSQRLRHDDTPDLLVLPLYARLSQKAQAPIFDATYRGKRRVILATNVAETSLTVPGIGYVIDSGLARLSRYSYRAKIQRLPIESIAQSSANQRSGRCGRITEGVCFRLYSEDDFMQRPLFTEPEIQRTNLAQVILQMASLKLGDIKRFDFIQPPEAKLINDGIKQLVDLKAINAKGHLTHRGRQMSQWPVDPKLSNMLIAAAQLDCLSEMLIITSALSAQDPKVYPPEKQAKAREQYKQFQDPRSDFVSILNLWVFVEEKRQSESTKAFQKVCNQTFLSFQKLKEWRDIHHQLKQVATQQKLTLNQQPADYTALHQAIIHGFADHIGQFQERHRYLGPRNRQFALFPGSGLYKKQPKWVVCAQLIETQKVYAHTVAEIQPQWVSQQVPHLIKKQYEAPFFSIKQGQVMAIEKSRLYGLLLEEDKKVPYRHIDPEKARALFIQAALVEEQMQSKVDFYLHNKALRKKIALLEEKHRRRDLLAADDQIAAFYQARLPEKIINQQALTHWVKTEKNNQRLKAQQADFEAQQLQGTETDFPSHIEWEQVKYRLKYHFVPGKDNDGVSVLVPIAALNRLPRGLFEWLVPGLLAEKCEAMLRVLPKQYRRQLVPIPETTQLILPHLEKTDIPLAKALVMTIKKTKGVNIPDTAFQLEQLADFYQPLYVLYDEKQKPIAQSRMLSQLLRDYGDRVQSALDKKIKPEQHQRSTRWDFGDLSKTQSFKQQGSVVTGFPAIKDDLTAVKVVLTDSVAKQAKTHRRGLVRLIMLTQVQQMKYLKKQCLDDNRLQLKMAADFDPDFLKQSLLQASVNHCYLSDKLPFTEAEFIAILQAHKNQLASYVDKVNAVLVEVIEADYIVRAGLQKMQGKVFGDIKQDIEQHRHQLLAKGFIDETPKEAFYHYPRYFKALQYRVEKVQNQLNKDKQHTQTLADIYQVVNQLIKDHPKCSELDEMQQLRWMLEEFRVSIFAQQLKTPYPVSLKRVKKQIDELKAVIATEKL